MGNSAKVRTGWVLSRALGVVLVAVVGAVMFGASNDSAPAPMGHTSQPDLNTAPWAFVADRLAGADTVMALLPDTQKYSKSRPDIFDAQTRWISANAERLGISFTAGLGDIVDSYDDDPVQWDRARHAMDLLTMPWWVAVGNHDMAADGSAVEFAKHFPWPDASWFGGSDGGKSSYAFGAGHLILFVEYCPTDATVEWADGVLDAHDEPAILVTHAFVETPTKRSDCRRVNSEGDNTADDLWAKLVVPHPNLNLVLSGHEHWPTGGLERTDRIGDRTVHELMSNYQAFANGGDGWLRLLAFKDCRIEVVTFSPTRDEALVDGSNLFSVPYGC